VGGWPPSARCRHLDSRLVGRRALVDAWLRTCSGDACSSGERGRMVGAGVSGRCAAGFRDRGARQRRPFADYNSGV